jgi:uncharacterized protein YraI
MKRLIAITAASTLLPAAALADVSGTPTADLNLRQGPGTQYDIIATMPEGAPIVIEGCLETYDWCRVSYDGATGYASASYLAADTGDRRVVVTQQPSLVDVVTAPVDAAGAAAGGVIGALGAAIGGVADAITPDPDVVRYVEENPADPVYLDGDVVVGAGVPDTVALREVPRTRYRYANINDRPVLVDPDDRRIVYVD